MRNRRAVSEEGRAPAKHTLNQLKPSVVKARVPTKCCPRFASSVRPSIEPTSASELSATSTVDRARIAVAPPALRVGSSSSFLSSSRRSVWVHSVNARYCTYLWAVIEPPLPHGSCIHARFSHPSRQVCIRQSRQGDGMIRTPPSGAVRDVVYTSSKEE
jgi:hypothetical protein